MYQSQQELIRSFKDKLRNLQFRSVSAILIGMIALIVPPLLPKSLEKNQLHIINIFSFLTGVGYFSYALIINGELRTLEGKSKMLEELEKELFIHEEINLFEQLKTPQQQQPQLMPNYQPPIDVVATPQPTENFEPTTLTVIEPPTHSQHQPCDNCGSVAFIGHGSGREKCGSCGKTRKKQ